MSKGQGVCYYYRFQHLRRFGSFSVSSKLEQCWARQLLIIDPRFSKMCIFPDNNGRPWALEVNERSKGTQTAVKADFHISYIKASALVYEKEKSPWRTRTPDCFIIGKAESGWQCSMSGRFAHKSCVFCQPLFGMTSRMVPSGWTGRNIDVVRKADPENHKREAKSVDRYMLVPLIIPYHWTRACVCVSCTSVSLINASHLTYFAPNNYCIWSAGYRHQSIRVDCNLGGNTGTVRHPRLTTRRKSLIST